MHAFPLKRTGASYFLWLVVAFEVMRHVVAFWIYWPVIAYGKLSLMASCRGASLLTADCVQNYFETKQN